MGVEPFEEELDVVQVGVCFEHTLRTCGLRNMDPSFDLSDDQDTRV